MGIVEFIYEGVVEPSYKNLIWYITPVLVTAEKEKRIQLVTYFIRDEREL